MQDKTSEPSPLIAIIGCDGSGKSTVSTHVFKWASCFGPTAIVMYIFTLRRVSRFKRMLAMYQQGYIIITDRFPQLDYPRAYDGPAFDHLAEGSFIVRWLAAQEQAFFEWMTSHRPDLVIRLNVDLDTACKRKPDHIRESLARKIKVTPLLKFNGAPIAEIDASKPLKKVLEQTERVVKEFLVGRGYT